MLSRRSDPECPKSTRTTSRPAERHDPLTRLQVRSRHRDFSSRRPSSSVTRSGSASTALFAAGIDSVSGMSDGRGRSTPPCFDLHAVRSRPARAIASTCWSTAPRHCLRSPPSWHARSPTSTSRAGSSHQSWTCRETTSPRSCATSSPSSRIVSTSECSRGRGRHCRSSNRRRGTFARCSTGSRGTPRSWPAPTAAPASCTVTTRRRL